MRESKYGIGDGLQSGFLGGITYRIIDRWLDGENEWHYRVSCDVWLSESQIVKMPDADVVEVATTSWEDIERVGFGSSEATCKHCQRRMMYRSWWKYCPECGAKVEEDNG